MSRINGIMGTAQKRETEGIETFFFMVCVCVIIIIIIRNYTEYKR